MDRRGVRRHHAPAGAGHHPVFTGTAAPTGFTTNLSKCPRPARQHRYRPDDVGSCGFDGAVLHRAGLCDGPLLQAAERASPRNASPGFSAIDRRCLRRAGRSRLRHPVPPPQSPHLAGRVHDLRDGGQSGLSVLQLGGPRAGDRRIERLWLHFGRASADGSRGARHTRRERGVGLLVDGQRPQSGPLRDRLVRLPFARRISFFL